MTGVLQEVLSGLSTLLLLFGGLAFWPLVRFGGGISDGAAVLLQRQFYTHIMLLAGSFVLLQYFYVTEHPARTHLQILPYAIGGLSWIAALIILFGTGLWRRLGKETEDSE
jgi:hypothetical protein